MASPSASSRAASVLAYQARVISESVSRISELVASLRCSPAATLVAHDVRSSPSPSPSPPPSTVPGANPRNDAYGAGEICWPKHFSSFRGLDFSSRLHIWGAPLPSPRKIPQFTAGGGGSLSGGVGLQVRTIFVEVKGNDLERAIRKWRRKCKEENLKALKDREYFMKPSEKRVLALKERDHRIARRSFKTKLNWILSRRQRGF